MTALFALPPAHAFGFTVPVDEVRWCAALAEALSVCLTAPRAERMAEVQALIDARPPVMLTLAWDNLINAATMWLAACTVNNSLLMLPFHGGARMIEAALRDAPVPVPAWAEQFQ